jgi:membrane-bound ClpP family serine protease
MAISFIAAVLMVFLLPLVLLREFIIGEASDRPIPQRDDSSESASVHVNSLPLGQEAVTVAPLKPSGVIELEGKRYNACSYTGGFIASGTRVQVCGERQGVTLVREVSDE